LVCVATPAVCLAFSDRPIDTWPFISATSRPDALAAWSRQQGLASGDIHVVASFEHYFLALAAAAGGMGFLVVPQILVYQALSQGQLLETTTPAVRGNADYVAYLNPQSAAPEAASAFCRWLKTLLRGEKQS
ncbi:MAG: LysR substrate-binding domain-containing protein, partial [Pseudomonadota bacterium]